MHVLIGNGCDHMATNCGAVVLNLLCEIAHVQANVKFGDTSQCPEVEHRTVPNAFQRAPLLPIVTTCFPLPYNLSTLQRGIFLCTIIEDQLSTTAADCPPPFTRHLDYTLHIPKSSVAGVVPSAAALWD